jgi:hypothetical protein
MDAFVELELKGKIGRPNAIIKRCFQRKNKSSVWTINGMCTKAGFKGNPRLIGDMRAQGNRRVPSK